MVCHLCAKHYVTHCPWIMATEGNFDTVVRQKTVSKDYYRLAVHPSAVLVGITGIDTSESLLEEAQKRLGQKVDLYFQNVSELDIGKKFDVAYSRGAAQTFFLNSNPKSETMLASHIFSF